MPIISYLIIVSSSDSFRKKISEMDLHIISSLFFRLLSVSILVNLPSFHATDDRYLNCISPFQCPNTTLNLSYPFWGSTRPNYCGHPLFEVNCSDELAPMITIMSTRYTVIDINYTQNSIRLATTDYLNTLCPHTPPSNSSSMNLTFFNYTDDTETLRLFYGCPSPVSRSCNSSLTIDGRNSRRSRSNLKDYNHLEFHAFETGMTYKRYNSSNSSSCATHVRSKNGNINNTFSCSNNRNSLLANYYILPNMLNSSIGMGPCNSSVALPIRRSEAQRISRSDSNVKNLVEALHEGFGLEWKLNESLCEKCGNSGGACGSDPSTGGFTCYCSNGTHPSACQTRILTATSNVVIPALYTKRRHWIKIVIASIITSLIVVILIAIFVYYYKRKSFLTKQVEEIIRLYARQTPKRYSYSEVKKMTNSFRNKLGQGGFSIVYKGKLSNGRDVAVKLLNKSEGDGNEFINEVASISTTSHVNIVTLLGFCFEWNKRVLIYEFMPKGSLDKYICQGGSSNNEHQLDLRTLYNIVIGIARGLDYLHRGCNTRILHFDIKPHNILLSEDLNPKISDFGLAKQCEAKESYVSMTGTRGTPGFIAPEVFNPKFGRASHKSDVYSYGMLILAMVGEKKNHNQHRGVGESSEEFFPDWIYKDLKQVEIRNSYWEAMTEEEEELVRKMIIVSLCCIQTIPSERPSMTEVVEMLGRSLDGLQIPPRPSLLSRARSPLISSSTS